MYFRLDLSCAKCPPTFRTRICFRNWNSTWRNHVLASISAHSCRVAPRITWNRRKFASPMLRGFRSLWKSSEREHGRRVIFRNIFRMHQHRGYVSNISTSDTERFLAEESWTRMNPRQVSMFFVFAFPCGMLRLCAHVRTHVVMRKRSRAIRLYKVPRYFPSVVYLYHRRAACTSVVNTAIGKSETNARWKMKRRISFISKFQSKF